MNPRKAELRKIVLDIVFGRSQVTYGPNQYNHLSLGVAELAYQKRGIGGWGGEQKLNEDDELLVQEIFWDLVVDKVLTIGSNGANPKYPFFRLHSEAKAKVSL